MDYADDVNLLGDNIDTINRNTETLIDASKEVGLEIIVEKTKYMLVPCDQNPGQNRDIKMGNRSFENMSQFKYLGRTFCLLVCCQEMQRLEYARLILPVVLYECETWSLILRNMK
jgi:hypothetical protein